MVGVDIDHCVNPETKEVEPWAEEVMQQLATYTEVSPSGTGLRLFGFGTLPGRDFNNSTQGIEMYNTAGNRYLTMTGVCLQGFEDIKNIDTEDLAKVYKQYRTGNDDSSISDSQSSTNGVIPEPIEPPAGWL